MPYSFIAFLVNRKSYTVPTVGRTGYPWTGVVDGPDAPLQGVGDDRGLGARTSGQKTESALR